MAADHWMRKLSNHILPRQRKQRVNWKYGKTLKAHPQWHNSSSKAPCPKCSIIPPNSTTILGPSVHGRGHYFTFKPFQELSSVSSSYFRTAKQIAFLIMFMVYVLFDCCIRIWDEQTPPWACCGKKVVEPATYIWDYLPFTKKAHSSSCTYDLSQITSHK